MVFISGRETNPYFNLAAEEYLLECGTGDIFLLWQNRPSVIIGKNQNAYAQLNLSFMENHGILAARRLTGGGAVFHDLGNVNFTFITDAPTRREIDFERFAVPIAEVLQKLGVPAVLDGRNDLLADGRKISGNAQCVYPAGDGRQRLLHHGTLLFSADLSCLGGALHVDREKMESKGIQSVESRVANIRDLPQYRGPDTVEGFLDALTEAAAVRYGAPRGYTPKEAAAIQELADKKYSTWDWIFGKSGAYSVTRERRFAFGTVSVSLNADKGVIRQITFGGDYFGIKDTERLADRLIGCRLEEAVLTAALAECADYIHGSTRGQIAELILGKKTGEAL